MQKITDKQFILSIFINILIFDFYRMKYERTSGENGRHFRENKVENFVERTLRFLKILNKICSVSFVHFREFRSTKISLETLYETQQIKKGY